MGRNVDFARNAVGIPETSFTLFLQLSGFMLLGLISLVFQIHDKWYYRKKKKHDNVMPADLL